MGRCPSTRLYRRVFYFVCFSSIRVSVAGDLFIRNSVALSIDPSLSARGSYWQVKLILVDNLLTSWPPVVIGGERTSMHKKPFRHIKHAGGIPMPTINLGVLGAL